MRSIYLLTIVLLLMVPRIKAQSLAATEGIDMMLLHGDYKRVIDTCMILLLADSLDPDLYFRMGVAYQNILEDDLSLSCFKKALSLDPENNVFKLVLAKGYYGNGKFQSSELLFRDLYSRDTMNWIYAYYLTSIYMQNNNYNNALEIYERFMKADTSNYVYIDKTAFAYLKKGAFKYATELYNKSLSINSRNIPALKNLAYLYAAGMKADTAIRLLSRGIEYDSTDIDLFVRRAQLYYFKHYTKRALDDYLVVLASGDSSVVFLKRTGIGYSNNLQPGMAIKYLLLAYRKDSSDYETCSYLGQNYYKVKDMKNSVRYFDRVLKILIPVQLQLHLTYNYKAESQKAGGQYRDAIDTYRKALSVKGDPNIYMQIANIYDEKLKDREKAISYYQMFLDNIKGSGMMFQKEYVETVRKRLDYLKNPPLKNN
jgi:tetratricopeptide (TPR) repeat protein